MPKTVSIGLALSEQGSSISLDICLHSLFVVQTWQAFFEQRWRPHLQTVESKTTPAAASWQARYGSKMRDQRVFAGRPRLDTFFGHRGGVKCLGLLPSCNLMATGQYSRLATTAHPAHYVNFKPCCLFADVVCRLLSAMYGDSC